MANIHPYKGYLNTEFHLFANGTDIISYEIFPDESDNPIQIGSFEPNKPCSISIIESGNYRISFSDGTSAKIIVEDGYKFGGSKYKTSFIFDKTPWCFVIMHDRTYFYNRDTKAEYVEAISPDEIFAISSDYIVLKNDGQDERTVYSLNDQRPILCISHILASTEKIIIWKEMDDDQGSIIIIYSLEERKVIKRIKVDHFKIDIEKALLLYHKNNVVYSCELDADFNTCELFSEKGQFGAFIGFEYVVFLSTDKRIGTHWLHIYKADDPSFEKVIDTECSVASINDIQFIDIESRKRSFTNLDLSQTGLPEATVTAKYAAFYFYPCKWDVFYTTREVKYTKQANRLRTEETVTLKSFNTRLNQSLKDSNNKVIITDYRFVIYNNCESYVKGREYSAAGYTDGGRIHTHQNFILLEKDGFNYTLSRNGYWDGKNACSYDYSLFEEFGILHQKEISEYRLIQSNVRGKQLTQFFTPTKYVVLGGTKILPGGKVLFKEADSKSFLVMPKAISPQCQYGLTIVKNCVYLLDISSRKETKTQILINTFDSSDYRDVLLGEDGNKILYRTSDNAEVKDITSGETMSFKNLSYVDHCNGIRPTFQMVASLQPRIVNPITGQILDCKLMKDYLFISPNGQYYAGTIKDLYDEYYYLETGEILSQNDYVSLKLKLTYPTGKGKDSEEWKEVTNRRISFVKEHFNYINKNNPFLTHNSNDERKWNWSLLQGYEGDYLVRLVIGVRGIALIRRMSDESVVAKIDLGSPLRFINYVSFSFDNRYVAIAGRYPKGSSLRGLFLVYDLDKHEVLLFQTNSRAVWLTAFNKYNQVAAYSGEPIVYDAMIPPLVEKKISR